MGQLILEKHWLLDRILEKFFLSDFVNDGIALLYLIIMISVVCRSNCISYVFLSQGAGTLGQFPIISRCNFASLTVRILVVASLKKSLQHISAGLMLQRRDFSVLVHEFWAVSTMLCLCYFLHFFLVSMNSGVPYFLLFISDLKHLTIMGDLLLFHM